MAINKTSDCFCSRQQDAFLHHGVSSLRPLIPRDIADAIGMHERITRAISNKCMATPRGVYALKYFFTPAMPDQAETVPTRRTRFASEFAA